ncbi:MAG: Fe-S protein assembly co-chaperone HscB [Oxalobacter formigenes]|nr:Fe-S protein assembly co-chaperone HscB [Oxalobacter formigenes]
MITNPFSLFGLPEQFDLDRAALEKAYKKYQEQPNPAYPAALVDEACQTLRQPLKRAACLCSLNGFPPQTGTTLSLPPEFLMEQITWRNQLDEARLEKRLDKLEKLDNRLRRQIFQQLEKIRHALYAREFANARQEIAKTRFLNKFSEEISFAFDKLEEPGKT